MVTKTVVTEASRYFLHLLCPETLGTTREHRWSTLSREVRDPMSVQEIEAAIPHLSPQELAELMAWLGEYHAQA